MNQRVVIIGAGVYGSAVADALTSRGAQVTVVESRSAGSGTSGATFSWTNAGDKQPRAYHDLNVAGMEAHRKLAAEVPGADWYHEGGNLEWADTDDKLVALQKKVEGAKSYGYAAEWLTRADVLRLEPDMAADQAPDTAAYFPDEGWIEPAAMIGVLLARAAAAGAEIITGDRAAAIGVENGSVADVTLASGRRLDADALVNCAGPRAREVAGLAGLDLPMRNSLGSLVYTSPVAAAIRRVIHAPDVHLRPDGGGRLLLHTHEIDDSAHVGVNGDSSVDPEAVKRLMSAGATLYPAIGSASVESVRVGERPIPGDGLPVLGRTKTVPNFYFAVSHSGATLSLHVASLIAEEVVGGASLDDTLEPFRFERF